jgi:hypothetical protein
MIAQSARRRGLALFALFLALPGAVRAEGNGSLQLSIAASLPDYASLGLNLTRDEGRARLELSADEWGASLALPWLAIGSLEPAGLAAFIQRPQGLSYRLGRYADRPFNAPPPLDAPLLGLVVGKEGGCFFAHPQSAGLASWSGAWLSPRSLPLSALTAWASLPSDSGDGGWNEPPSPALVRSWHAIGGAFRLGPWRSALGAGAMHSSPGADAWTLRLENLFIQRPFTFESVAALSLGSWRGPSDSLAPALFLDAKLSAGWKRLGLSFDYDESRNEWAASPLRSITLAGRADTAIARLQASAEAGFSAFDAIRELELRLLCSPAALPWLSAYGSWRLNGPEPERLELGCSLKAGQRQVIALDALWRADTEGRYLKLGGSYAFTLPRGRLLVYLKTDGWRRYEPSPAGAAAPLAAGLRYSQSFP